MKIDWKRKLSSRKFWVAVAGFIAPILLAFGVADSTATQITGLIASCGSIIAYMLAEGIADSSRPNGNPDSSSSGNAPQDTTGDDSTPAIGFSTDDSDDSDDSDE